MTSNMVKEDTIELFLDGLASRKGTPGGGSAAALIGAMGAALVSMVCNLTIGKPHYREFEEELESVLRQAEGLRRELTKMVEEDIEAFDLVMRANGMPRLTKMNRPCVPRRFKQRSRKPPCSQCAAAERAARSSELPVWSPKKAIIML